MNGNRTFLKADDKDCRAEVKVLKTRYDGLTSFRARVDFFNLNTRLFYMLTNVDRLTEDDAVADAIFLMNEGCDWKEN